MGLSRETRIITLLVIDSVFFLIELITGYAVGSLALVADSFHMLNDVLSLVVALYTIKLATSPSSARNSYGWQRAEILGALINGVFLVALCVSIFLEAIGRIVSPPEISNPKLIVVVGSLGLLSNIVGLFLFHEHGHSHGHSHDHSHGASEESGAATPNQEEDQEEDPVSELYQHPAQTRAQVIETAQEYGYGQSIQLSSSLDSGVASIKSPPSGRGVSASRRSGRGSFSRPKTGRFGSGSRIIPSIGQNEVLPPVGSGSNVDQSASSSASGSTAVADPAAKTVATEAEAQEHEHDLQHAHSHHAKTASDAEAGKGDDHGHSHGGDGGHGHSHGNMNMRGVFLHVVGDALGNVGVIAAGLVIWLVGNHGWTLYFDPGVSLLITCIIFSSAIPLVKSASYILLQGVPSHVSLDAVRRSIMDVNGVDSIHELHIWQLSESTVVASVHVRIVPGADYMVAANGIRSSMHSHGIHSVTIQPEFFDDGSNETATDDACLIRCPPDECSGDTCCPPKVANLIDIDDHDDHANDDHGNNQPPASGAATTTTAA